jgi:hypothetical protein
MKETQSLCRQRLILQAESSAKDAVEKLRQRSGIIKN